MKTLEISDEDYEFLKEAQNLLKTQDNRYTRDPIYSIMQKTKEWGIDSNYSDKYEWIRDGEDNSSTSEELFDELYEEEIKELREMYCTEMNIDLEEAPEQILKTWFEEQLQDSYTDVEFWLEEKGFRKVYYTIKNHINENLSMFSFFEKDVVDYVKSKCYGEDNGNKYDIFSYGLSSWRANRMNKLRSIIENLQLGE